MSVDLTAGIVRILTSDGGTAGTGFVVTDEGLIATCAHVVEGAGAGAGQRVLLAFHATAEEREVRVEPEWWRPPDAEDVAILRLDGPLPEGVTSLPLGSSAGVEGHALSTFGFPDPKPVEGMASKCEVVGRTTERGFPVLQLRSSEVTPGFSGAPVLDTVTRRVVGMVTAITTPDRYGRQSETAFVTPVETLQAICPSLLEGTPEAHYRNFLRMAYGFWERRFTSLEMTAEEREELPEVQRSWIPPSFSALEEQEVSRTDVAGKWEGEPPTICHVRLPGGLPQALDQYGAVVLLGAPGSGKSTALAHFAGQIPYDLERIPILVPLRRYEQDEEPLSFLRRTWALALQDHLRETIRAGEVEPVPLHKVGEATAPLAAQLEHLVAQGRLTLLLDGLNEMPGLTQDDARLSRLAAFLESARARGNRIVVACRVLDYAALRRPLEHPLQQVTLEPLDDQRIQDFLRNYLSDEEGNSLYGWLRQRERRSIRELCRVPFFLRLVAYLYERQGEPPARRVELLDRYIHVAVKREQKQVRQDWPPTLLMEPLSELALVMQEQEKLEIWEDEARRHLYNFLEGGASAALRIAEGSGLLRLALTSDPCGARVRFIHQLWQQHLAARALVKQSDENGALLFETLQPHLLEERWREIVILSAAMLENGTELVEQLLAAVAGDEDQQRLLFLAAEAVAEGAVSEEAARRQIVDGLEQLIRTRYLWENKRADASNALATMGRLTGKYAAERILALARDTDLDLRKRWRAAETLDNTNQTIEAAKAWLSLARNRELDLESRWRAAKALNELDRADAAAQAWLSIVGDRSIHAGMRLQAAEEASRCGREERAIQAWSILAHGKGIDAEARIKAVCELGALGQVNEGAFILLDIAYSGTLDARKRIAAARALSRLNRTEKATSILLAIAREETTERRVREQAILTLGTVGAGSALLALARDETLNTRMSVRAVEALGELKQVDETVAVLLSLVYDETVAPQVRVRAAEALGGLKQVDEAIAVLLRLVRDEMVAAQVRRQAIEALSELGQVEEAVAPLLSLACDETVAAQARTQAMEALTELGQIEESVAALLSLARDETVTAWMREQAAEALSELGQIEEAVAVLLSLAQDETVATHVRKQAAEALGELGQIEEAVAVLLSLAQDETIAARVRRQAIEVLSELGQVEEAVAVLLSLVCDETVAAQVRVRAAEALGGLGQIEEAVAVLLSLAQDEAIAARVRRQAIEVLSELGQVEEATATFLSLARDDTVAAQVRVQAAEALGELGQIEEAVAVLLSLVRDETIAARVRRQAIEVLSELGQIEEATAAFLSLARDDTVAAQVRVRTAEALVELGQIEEAVVVLLSLACDETVAAQVREQAVETLGGQAQAVSALGQMEDDRALGLLLTLLQDKYTEVRGRAASALGRLKAERVVEPLVTALRDESAEVRGRAASALGELGGHEDSLMQIVRKRAVEPLLVVLQDESAGVRRRAVSALRYLGDERVVEPLVTALRDESARVRRRAVSALGQLGRHEDSLMQIVRKRAVEPLLAVLQDEDAEVRCRAANALGNLGDERVVEPLVTALRDEDAKVRCRAANALGNLGDARAIEPLLASLQDASPDARHAAVVALGGRDLRMYCPLQPMVESLFDEDARVRRSAAWALGLLGDKQAVEPLLNALREDADGDVRRLAAQALKWLGELDPE